MGYDVVSFGETMLRLSPARATRLEEARDLQVYAAGTESNVLACLSRLGLSCAWLSALPANPPGRLVARELQGHGIDLSHVVWDDPRGRVGLYWVEESPPPLGTQVQYDRAGSSVATLSPDQLDLSVLDGAHILHLTGITPALSSQCRAVFERLLAHAEQTGVSVSFDVNYRAKLWSPHEAARQLEAACRAADLVFCTRADAEELWGWAGSPGDVLRRMQEGFSQSGKEQTFVLTLGAEGAVQLQGGELSHAPAYTTSGTARFGSGDAFAAGYLYAYLRGAGVAEAGVGSVGELAFGNALAALKRCIEGDIAVVTLEEVLAVLRGGETRFR